jgi:hypothetical protein
MSCDINKYGAMTKQSHSCSKYFQLRLYDYMIIGEGNFKHDSDAESNFEKY